MQPQYFELLKGRLQADVVPHLPALVPNTKPVDLNATKNLSRAFSAWALAKMLGTPFTEAAQAVVDDFDDGGVDAIFYEPLARKLYLLQGKLKNGEDFSLPEAQKLLQGVRDIVNQRYAKFNKHVQDRQGEIEHALEDCKEIVLVVAFTGNLLSKHAADACNSFLALRAEVDERLSPTLRVYAPQDVESDLLATQALKRVNTTLAIRGCQKIDTPRVCYYGQIAVADLVALYNAEGNALFERNIRYFIGLNSGVNQSIQISLKNRPEQFFYLSNGVTAIAETIEAAGNFEGGRRLRVQGLSVINGAQSIASASAHCNADTTHTIPDAMVLITLIRVPAAEHEFALDVTKSRNHQNPVAIGNFAALDPIHERLRRELSLEGVDYLYRPEDQSGLAGRSVVRLPDAAQALAIFHPNPNFSFLIRNELGKLTDRDSTEYKQLFAPSLTGRRLANATRLFVMAKAVLAANVASASGDEKSFYRHGWVAVLWVAFQKNLNLIPSDHLLSESDAGKLVSKPVDDWRDKVWTAAKEALNKANKGALAFFRNKADTLTFLLALKTSKDGAGA